MLGQVLALTLLLLIKGHQGQGKEAQPGRGGLAWTRSCGLQGNQDVSLWIVLLTWSPGPVTRSSSLQLWAGWVRQHRLAVGWEVLEKCASGHAISNPGHLGKILATHSEETPKDTPETVNAQELQGLGWESLIANALAGIQSVNVMSCFWKIKTYDIYVLLIMWLESQESLSGYAPAAYKQIYTLLNGRFNHTQIQVIVLHGLGAIILAGSNFNFTSKDFTLLIEAAQPQDSGLYILEVTSHAGNVWKHQFNVSIFDRVEKPHLVEKWKVLDGGICQVTLSCSVARGGDVSYAWYKGSNLIQIPGNITELVENIDVNASHVYTCNVSNPVSWANHSLQLTQGCQSDHQDFTFLIILVSIVILLMALFLSTLTYICVWRRKRKQSRTSPKVLTIYEDVNNLRTRSNQEQKPLGEGNTIYSTIQAQASASTSQDNANTLYSLVQASWKTGSKKMKQSPSFDKTIYEEVGKRPSKAENPARLSRRELENFCVYS
ncbi:hypothetical protein E5288_WYG005343 [Bos mutus]|uniref:Ig-like domain-containing protein n=1 Tax=Bos mutus TaxID=72004 RepID=A0A6B0S646_9CETA|nr:hypothetical protein [Bos mutus]